MSKKVVQARKRIPTQLIMRLTKQDRLFGLPARPVRDLFKQHCMSGFSLDVAATRLKIKPSLTRKALAEAVSQEYLAVSCGKGRAIAFTLTAKGNQLALATFSPPIKRDVAARSLERLLTRVDAVNAESKYMMGVAKVALFGSMLRECDCVSDVDVAILLRPRWAVGTFSERLRERVAAALRDGRRLNSWQVCAGWAQDEVWRYLYGGDRRLSLHEWSELAVLGCDYKNVFEVNELSPDRKEEEPGTVPG